MEISGPGREYFMRPICLAVVVAAGIALSASMGLAGLAQQGAAAGPYKILKTAKVGGEGGFDYIFADVDARRLYIPRGGAMGQLTVFKLDTLEPVGTIPSVKSGGAVVDPKSHHGFSTTKPITMWDSNTLQVIKTIDVDGHPDGIDFDPFNERVWVLSHTPPYATVIDAKEGAVVGTVDVGGAPEQLVSDDQGTVYVNISDKGSVGVVDAKSMTVKAKYDFSAQGTHGSGMALDAKNHILFAYMRDPKPVVVILNADNGNLLATFPTGEGVDTVAFNPATMESISAETAGTMTFIKENSPTSFEIEQILKTMPVAKTMALDTKTNHIFTMTGEFAPPPANAAPAPVGREGSVKDKLGIIKAPAHGPMLPGSFTILMIGRQ
jgi:DNA-binding beta-propeller fold protein YncE